MAEKKGGEEREAETGRTNQGFLALSRGARARFLLGDDGETRERGMKEEDKKERMGYLSLLTEIRSSS